MVGSPTLRKRAKGIVEHHSAAASRACRLSKLALIERFALRYHEILEHGLLLQDRAMSPEDFKKALASYREKRTPVWRSTGRPQQ
jgi:hypothetical protein